MKKNKAFTLMELLLVLAIIGILAASALGTYLFFLEKSKSAEALINISAIRKGEEIRKVETGSYIAADGAEEINRLLSTGITSKYYEYEVTGVTDDNFIVIARRIGLGLDDYLSLGALMGTAFIAMDRSGTVQTDYQPSGGGGDVGDTGDTGGSSGGGFGGGTTGGGGGGGTGGSGGGGYDGYREGGTVTTEMPPEKDTSNSGGGWSNFAPTGGSGAVIDPDIQAAIDLLQNSSYASYAYTIIEAKQIIVKFSDLSDNIGAQWSYGTHTIEVNDDYRDGNMGAVAALIAHESTHADYDYYSGFWTTTTLERHPELTEADLHINTHPFNSINQEYDCFCNQMKTWIELRTEPDDNNDGWLYWYYQGEADMKAQINEAYLRSGQVLPDY